MNMAYMVILQVRQELRRINQMDGSLVFTPKLVAGVWVGAESPQVHFRTMRAGQGSSAALPIWGKIHAESVPRF